jgi:transcriptional regulator with XRE-family HTH domain
MVEEEVRRVARLLGALTKVRKVPTQRLERKLGLGAGTLHRVFAGRIELKVRHILEVLEALGVEPLWFFRQAFEERTAETEAGSAWVLEAVKDLLKRDSPTAADRSAAEIHRLLLQILYEQGILPPTPPEEEPDKPQ